MGLSAKIFNLVGRPGVARHSARRVFRAGLINCSRASLIFIRIVEHCRAIIASLITSVGLLANISDLSRAQRRQLPPPDRRALSRRPGERTFFSPSVPGPLFHRLCNYEVGRESIGPDDPEGSMPRSTDRSEYLFRFYSFLSATFSIHFSFSPTNPLPPPPLPFLSHTHTHTRAQLYSRTLNLFNFSIIAAQLNCSLLPSSGFHGSGKRRQSSMRQIRSFAFNPILGTLFL